MSALARRLRRDWRRHVHSVAQLANPPRPPAAACKATAAVSKRQYFHCRKDDLHGFERWSKKFLLLRTDVSLLTEVRPRSWRHRVSKPHALPDIWPSPQRGDVECRAQPVARRVSADPGCFPRQAGSTCLSFHQCTGIFTRRQIPVVDEATERKSPVHRFSKRLGHFQGHSRYSSFVF